MDDLYENTPSREEQEQVSKYVLERPLVRPNTSYKKAFLCTVLFVSANTGITFLLYYLFLWLNTTSALLRNIDNFCTDHSIAVFALLALFQFLIGGIIALKPALIGAIRLYQRYAPERVRRKCLLKPTCSEYAIIAIQKYGVMRGVYKTYKRLFFKCCGGIYRIDEP